MENEVLTMSDKKYNENSEIIEDFEKLLIRIKSVLEERISATGDDSKEEIRQETERDAPRYYKTQKSYEKLLEDIADQLFSAIKRLKDNH